MSENIVCPVCGGVFEENVPVCPSCGKKTSEMPFLILKRTFGYDAFKGLQEEIVRTVLRGQDLLAVMPTGSGKSLCYQIPALLFEGITLVVSPLISLMQDQVRALRENGVPAAYINSSLTENQIAKALSLASCGAYRIVYVAPERLESPSFAAFAEQTKIALVAVDEAHCISQWGQDFRPSYLRIAAFVDTLPQRPVIAAFTATATPEVKEDIVCCLGLRSERVFTAGFDRPNLYFEVGRFADKEGYILNYIKAHPGDSGIIYCATRKKTDELQVILMEHGVSAGRYHAGMGAEARRLNQEAFINDDLPVIVATNAFGMGIDKSNVRFVIHYNMPQSMENYYQEAGRAGRDGESANCILLFSPQDVIIDRFLIEKKEGNEELTEEERASCRKRDMIRLKKMEDYCKTSRCLRRYVLEYFGDRSDVLCDNCGNCLGAFKEEDVTKEARCVFNCIYETHARYGASVIAGILTGSSSERMTEISAPSLRTYNALGGENERRVKQIILSLLDAGYLTTANAEYKTLALGEKAYGVKKQDAKVYIRALPESRRRAKRKKTGEAEQRDLTALGFELFDELRALRRKLAARQKIAPYMVFSDRTLRDMCLKLPRSEEKMLDVQGVAAHKYSKYGREFLDVVTAFVDSHAGERIVTVDREAAEREKAGRARQMEEEKARKAEEKARKEEEKARRKEEKARAREEERKKKMKAPFYLLPDDAGRVEVTPAAFISEIRERMIAASTAERIKKLTYDALNGYLIDAGYLEARPDDENRKRVPTARGKDAGITEVRTYSERLKMSFVRLSYPASIQRELIAFFTHDAPPEDQTAVFPASKEETPAD